jgi:hypothetical protein
MLQALCINQHEISENGQKTLWECIRDDAKPGQTTASAQLDHLPSGPSTSLSLFASGREFTRGKQINLNCFPRLLVKSRDLWKIQKIAEWRF